jgi:hypothetical protein
MGLICKFHTTSIEEGMKILFILGHSYTTSALQIVELNGRSDSTCGHTYIHKPAYILALIQGKSKKKKPKLNTFLVHKHKMTKLMMSSVLNVKLEYLKSFIAQTSIIENPFSPLD